MDTGSTHDSPKGDAPPRQPEITPDDVSRNLLKQSEDQFRLLVQGIEDYAIFLLDHEGHVTSWNAGAARINGFSSGDVLGKHYSILFPPEEAAAGYPQQLLQAATKERLSHDEGWRVRKDGTRYWARSVLTALKDPNGNLRGFAKILHDDTQRRNAEEATRRSEERLRAVIESAVDGVITIDERGRILEINPATVRLFGYAPAEIVGHNVSRLMPSPYREEHDHYLQNYLDTSVRKIIGIGREVIGKRKDGGVFPMHLAVSEARLSDQRIFTGIIRDLSERHRAQQELLKSERLAAIGEMVTGLAHESRNALQRTKACLEMLELELEDRPEALDLVHRIQSAQDHVHALYEEVRDYAAPVILSRANCLLSEVWREAWTILGHDRSANINFRVNQDTSDLSCLADRRSLVQLFRIIFENAIAACGDSGVVTLSVANGAGESPSLDIRIADTGPGLTPDQRERIFEPFFTTKTKGTGLGMAIAKRIVEAHGGEISAANRTAGSSPRKQDASGVRTEGAEIRIVLPRSTPNDLLRV